MTTERTYERYGFQSECSESVAYYWSLADENKADLTAALVTSDKPNVSINAPAIQSSAHKLCLLVQGAWSRNIPKT